MNYKGGCHPQSHYRTHLDTKFSAQRFITLDGQAGERGGCKGSQPAAAAAAIASVEATKQEQVFCFCFMDFFFFFRNQFLRRKGGVCAWGSW